MSAVVAKLKQDFDAIHGIILAKNDVSLATEFNQYFLKNMVLGAASYYEKAITDLLGAYIKKMSGGDERILAFVRRQAFTGKYHQLFTWGAQDKPEEPGTSANSFFALFGKEFAEQAKKAVKEDQRLDESIKAFLLIGHLRNLVVHSNFADYQLQGKTSEDIYVLFNQSEYFVDFLRKHFST